jgi:hypothetical protein
LPPILPPTFSTIIYPSPDEFDCASELTGETTAFFDELIHPKNEIRRIRKANNEIFNLFTINGHP